MLNSFSLIDAAAMTDVGKVRKNNEDAVLLLPKAQCYVVSDGMGGGKAGEVASAMMVQEIESAMAQVCVVESALQTTKFEQMAPSKSDKSNDTIFLPFLSEIASTIVSMSCCLFSIIFSRSL